MTDRKPINEGYQPSAPELLKKGYQPILDTPHRPAPDGGYQPVSTGDSPANVPSPPKEL